MSHIMLIYNPTAGSLQGRLHLIRQLEKELSARGLMFDSLATNGPDDAARLAREAVARQCETLLVCGGDGTINEAVQELAGSQTRLAVFPCGTANVFAREIGVLPDPQKVSQMLVSGHTRTISLGRACQPETKWQRYFLLMAGIGIDAELVRSVSPQLKSRIGQGAYFSAGIEYLLRWPLVPFTLSVEGRNYQATFATIANAARYGGGFTIAPGARMDDKVLNVCLFDSDSRFAYLGYAVLALSGSHIKCRNVTYLTAQRVTATSEQEVFVQLDGEPAGSLPMNFDLVPEALRITVPER